MNFAILALAIAAGRGPGLEPGALYQQNYKATVEIFALDEKGPQKRASGFILQEDGKTYLVTARHVVESLENSRDLMFCAFSGECYAMPVPKADKGPDVFAIRLTAVPPGTKAVRLAREEPAVGARTYSIANPDLYNWVLSEGLVSRYYTAPAGAVLEDLRGYRFIMSTTPLYFGSSGSPLYNSSGEVVGVASWIDKKVRFTNFFTSLEDVRREVLSK